jgi:hypothetical protein
VSLYNSLTICTVITRERSRVNLRSGLINFRKGSKTPQRLVGASASIRPKEDNAGSDKLYQLVYELYNQFKDVADSSVWESEKLKKKLAKAMSKDFSQTNEAATISNSSLHI